MTVVEDACQAHLAEWKGKKVGTYGRAGCFSFQASKNLNCAEGGAILTNDAELAEACYRFHNNSRGRATAGSADFSYRGVGANLRLTDFQAAMLLAQMTRLEQQAAVRDANGAYLTSLLSAIHGITPARRYAGLHAQRVPPLHVPLRRVAFRRPEPRRQFLKALRRRRHSRVGRLLAAHEGTLSHRDALQPGV